MRVLVLVGGAALMAATLSACVFYHQERPALRMARPEAEPAALAAYTPPRSDYPTVGGDILKGTSPAESAAYQATTGPAELTPPAATPSAPPPAKPRP
jgi:hypothetical protein